jgi:hypothetical protein
MAYTTIYIQLMDEGIDVWRPVAAVQVTEDVFRIDPKTIVPKHEHWQFGPGQEVRCRKRMLDKDEGLVAIDLAI